MGQGIIVYAITKKVIHLWQLIGINSLPINLRVMGGLLLTAKYAEAIKERKRAEAEERKRAVRAALKAGVYDSGENDGCLSCGS